MSTETLIPIMILATYFFMLTTERIWPARDFPRTPFWTAIGLGFLVLTMGLNAIIPALLPTSWIASHSLLPGYKLGVAGGILIGFPFVALLAALSHRTCHHFNFLWRWVHQTHHSAVRLDMPGSLLFHPFDILLNSVVAVFATVFLLGLDPLAGAWVGFIQTFFALFQHWNVRTPAVLGYIIQRPESHCVHHQRDLHAYNYSDFPLWDMVMGTFRNPPEWSGAAGFEPDRAMLFGRMLVGRDVNPAMENGAKAQS